jgi:hypothetical protein
MTDPVVVVHVMSFQEGLIEEGEQSAYGDDRGGSTESLAISEEETGLRGRLRRHFDTWARLYAEQVVEARTGRRN